MLCQTTAVMGTGSTDRLVCGVNHDTIQTRLLAEKDLTYEKVLEIAQAVEAARLILKSSKMAPVIPLYFFQI